MAASLLTLRRCCSRTGLAVARRACSSSPVAPLPLYTRFLLRLSQQFHDVEKLLGWSSGLRKRVVQRKNVFYSYAQRLYGNNVAAAYYILSLKGGFRFAGQSEWFRPDSRGKFSFDFVNFPDLLIEEVDMSGTSINLDGLDNLVSQLGLCSLSLRGCAEVDDWFLSRLHIFGDSLEELDLSHCPRVTEGGLPALQNLRKLRRLDVSSLPRVKSPGLVRILLEEMLPHCHVTGAEYDQGLILQQPDTDTLTAESSEPQKEAQSETTSSQRHVHAR